MGRGRRVDEPPGPPSPVPFPWGVCVGGGGRSLLSVCPGFFRAAEIRTLTFKSVRVMFDRVQVMFWGGFACRAWPGVCSVKVGVWGECQNSVSPVCQNGLFVLRKWIKIQCMFCLYNLRDLGLLPQQAVPASAAAVAVVGREGGEGWRGRRIWHRGSSMGERALSGVQAVGLTGAGDVQHGWQG